MSHGSDTIELISSVRPSPYPLSISDTDTLCVLIDNGKVVNSSGQVMKNIDMVEHQDSKKQMESLWSIIISLPILVSELEKIQDNIENTLEKVSTIYQKINVKLEKSTKKNVKDSSRIVTPIAALSNGNIRTNVGLNFQNNKSQSKNTHIPGVGDNYVLKRSLDKSFSNFNDEHEHSSLMTRSIFSTSFISNQTTADKPDPIHIIKLKLMNKRVTLNVGGERHEVLWKTLEQMPQSRLGMLASATTDGAIRQCVDYYSLVDNEFFFDRHPRSFLSILNFYQLGRLHTVDELCVIAFNDDLDYWKINPLWLEACCQNKFLSREEFIKDEWKKDASLLKKDEEEQWGDGVWARSKQFMWDLFEKPESSLAAKVVSWVSVLFVVISTIAMILNTMEEFSGPPDENGRLTDNPILSMLETICIMWFTLEYILRLTGAPRKCAFLKDFMNIVDLLAILPFFITIVVLEATPEGEDQQEIQNIRQTISVFRIMRVLRIFKLARHSTGLKSIAYTLTNSYKELGLLVLFMSLGVLVFASLIFFAEKDEEDTSFTSIPISFWWAVITMTTVGYGDMSPNTGIGMCVAITTCISGVLVMSLPVPIIVNNFSAFYHNTKRVEVTVQRRADKKAMQIEEEQQRLKIEREENIKLLESGININ